MKITEAGLIDAITMLRGVRPRCANDLLDEMPGAGLVGFNGRWRGIVNADGAWRFTNKTWGGDWASSKLLAAALVWYQWKTTERAELTKQATEQSVAADATRG